MQSKPRSLECLNAALPSVYAPSINFGKHGDYLLTNFPPSSREGARILDFSGFESIALIKGCSGEKLCVTNHKVGHAKTVRLQDISACEVSETFTRERTVYFQGGNAHSWRVFLYMPLSRKSNIAGKDAKEYISVT